MMRCAVLTEPGNLLLEEQPIPIPGPGAVLVKVAYCGICGTDLLIYEGKFPTHFPYSPGHEYSGIIAGLGLGVERFRLGEPVAIDPNYACGHCHFCHQGKPNLCENLKVKVKSNGGFADFVALPEQMVHPLPASLSLKHAVLAESLSCVLHALDRAAVKDRDSVVILGAGTLGLLLLQLVRRATNDVIIVTEPKAVKREVARQLGADIIIDSSIQNVATIVQNHTQGYKADIVFDSAGLPQTVKSAFQIVKRGGTIILLGICPEGVEISISPSQISREELTVHGVFLNPHTFSRALEILAQGAANAEKLITHLLPLEKLEEGFRLHKSGESIKTVIVLDPDIGFLTQ